MHLFHAPTRFYGGNAIVAGGLPTAAGLAFADAQLKRNQVSACYFSEGAMAEGARPGRWCGAGFRLRGGSLRRPGCQ